ncbi:cytochrome c peroxidase [Chitinophaga japonensis]|uniref:Cytochrome c peroxidase n=1 Tax=Chitinophaga japonensis TaxID=104662 RepID=A0A562TDT1_CHIJA|nr:cytochrome c peroxidase [Chitinophaga japonensis]TWI91717.1 cytochrome c peroxidase [Chitinophaga japonensis]
MRISVIVITVTLVAILAYSIFDLRADNAAPAAAQGWFDHETDVLEQRVDALCKAIEQGQSTDKLQAAFRKARLAYKPIELLAAYYMPYTNQFINGPNIPEVEPDEKNVIIQPEGFQVLEALLFAAPVRPDTAAIRMEARRLRSSLQRLQGKAGSQPFTDAQLFDAMRQELLRIASLGLSGFDSPEAEHSLPEAAAALHGVETVWHFYTPRVQLINPALAKHTEALLHTARRELQAAPDFNALDRLRFISKYLNPLTINLKLAREALNIPYARLPHFLDPAASNAFAKGAFDPVFYAPNNARAFTAEQTALGRRLFYDPVLSYNQQRSCATCHHPAKAFTDGLRTPAALPGEALVLRNTPTLLNAALQPAQFYDMRVAYLEDQVQAVVHNKAEMHGNLEEAALRLQQEKEYRQLFREAFHIAPPEINGYRIQQAIATYIRSLVRLNSPFDAYMQGDTTQLTAAAKRGFNIFMGKAKCGTCHFMPLFNGVAPPDFARPEVEIIGVPAAKDKAMIDADSGRYGVHKIPLHRYAFKTPTLRNVALTAPYMHNGVFNTLEEVMDFYNNGGGIGMGMDLDTQTLPADSLHLSQREQQDVIAFMQALTDTTAF